MASEWQGKSKGTVLGYRIFVFFMKHVGMGAAYFILY
ncbi:MAG: lipid A biosynthesis acyltransferase, partial [Xanthomarina sp.]